MNEPEMTIPGRVAASARRDLAARVLDYASKQSQAAEKAMRDNSGDWDISSYQAGKSDAYNNMEVYLTAMLKELDG